MQLTEFLRTRPEAVTRFPMMNSKPVWFLCLFGFYLQPLTECSNVQEALSGMAGLPESGALEPGNSADMSECNI